MGIAMEILLKNGHIVLPAPLVQNTLHNEMHVSLAFYPERNTLLIAAKSKTFFEKLHKTHEWQVLKDKNLKGDKSLFVRGILLDNELEDHDRALSYEVKSTGIISIQL
jgi:hypothetical protein